MIKQLNKKQYNWIESTLLVYTTGVYIINITEIHRLDEMLKCKSYDNNPKSADMQSIDSLKQFYIHSKQKQLVWAARPIWQPVPDRHQSYFTGVDMSDINDHSTTINSRVYTDIDGQMYEEFTNGGHTRRTRLHHTD